ncbi:hypothetical protein L1987_64673 [Smallanthus sonchifolius]|uniref:Uncharacterized protein n=1 Tax=Smallanthus sonchifolius TaxID=185202 RepID=A0ACB9BSE7_9ASTR|nr:hypothetical protein L1987_64673 [Smallanthus sonchifolius]
MARLRSTDTTNPHGTGQSRPSTGNASGDLSINKNPSSSPLRSELLLSHAMSMKNRFTPSKHLKLESEEQSETRRWMNKSSVEVKEVNSMKIDGQVRRTRVLIENLGFFVLLDQNLDWGIATWAQDSIKAGRVKDIVDSDIKGEISTKCLKQFARIAERCLDNHPKNRPNMDEVVLGLEHVLTLQEKTSNLLQTTRKTIFGRMVHKFSFTENGQNSGIPIFSFMYGFWITHALEALHRYEFWILHAEEVEATYA